MKEKFRFFNYRPLFVAFVSLSIGLITALCIFNKSVWGIILPALFLAILIFYIIIHRNIKYLIYLLIATLGICSFFIQKKTFKADETFPAQSVITGRVYYSSNFNGNLRLKDVEVNGKEVDFNVYVYNTNVETSSSLNDYTITFVTTDFYPAESYTESVNSTFVSEKIKYIAYTNDIVLHDKDFNLKTQIQNIIKDRLNRGLDTTNATIIYSALFGDKTEMTEETRNYFNAAGLAHILAVSGLHVGIIVMLLSFILKLFKCNDKIKLLLISAFLIFYIYLCDGAYPVIRASIMSMLFLVSPIVKTKYDSLSAASLSGLLILLFQPVALFDISFLLTFSCAFGIAFFYKPLKKFLVKTKLLNNWIGDILILSIIANVSTIFCCAYFLEGFNLVGIISNILILPIFTLCFVVSFVVAIISSILPFIASTLRFINPLIEVICTLTYSFFKLDMLNFSILHTPFIIIPIFFAILLFASRFFLKGKGERFTILSILIITCVTSLITNNVIINPCNNENFLI